MTLNDIQLATYRRTGYADTPATEVVTRIQQWINLWQSRLLTRPGIQILSDLTVPFTAIAGQSRYTLPIQVRRVQKIVDPVTPVALRMESLRWIREHDPQLNAIGIPELWAPVTWTMNPGVPPPALIIHLWPTPGAALTYNVDTHITPPDLLGPTDTPALPLEYHWLLVEAACYEEWMRKADTRSGTARQDLETGFKEMRHWLSNPADYQPTNLPETHQPSRLGGMYPGW